MAKKYKSPAAASIHEMMSDLRRIGAIDKQTMRNFDESCLAPIKELSSEEIRTIRESQNVSQAVFALYLNVSTTSVSQWERGEKKPAGPALKLLSIVKQRGLTAIV
jgi:putative transcriptional regulator